MNIVSKYIRVPYKKYKIKTTGFATRRLTVIEWLLLHIAKDFSDGDQNGRSLQSFMEDVLLMESNSKMIFAGLEYLSNQGLILVSGTYNEFDVLNLTPSQLHLTGAGEKALAEGYVAGDEREGEDEISFDLATLTLASSFYDYSFQEADKSAKSILTDEAFKQEFPHDKILESINAGSLLFKKYKGASVLLTDVEKTDEENDWRIDALTLQRDANNELVCNFDVNEAVLEAIKEGAKSKYNTEDYSTEYELKNVPDTAKFGAGEANLLTQLVDYSDAIFISNIYYDSLKKKEGKLLKGKTCFIYDSRKFDVDNEDNTAIYLPLSLAADDVMLALHTGEAIKTGKCCCSIQGNELQLDFVYPFNIGSNFFEDVRKVIKDGLEDIPEMLPVLYSPYLIREGDKELAEEISLLLNKMETASEKAMFLSQLKGACSKLQVICPDIKEYADILISSCDSESVENLTAEIERLYTEFFRDDPGVFGNMLIAAARTIDGTERIKTITSILSLVLIAKDIDINDFSARADATLSDGFSSTEIDKFFMAFEEGVPELLPAVLSINKNYNELAQDMLFISGSLGGYNWYEENQPEEVAASILNCTNLAKVKRCADSMKQIIDNLNNTGCLTFTADGVCSQISDKLDALQDMLNCFAYPADGAAKADIFLIDTNAFINTPDILNYFKKDEMVRVPLTVIKELDYQKDRGTEEVSKAARKASKEIEKRDRDDRQFGNIHFLVEGREYPEFVPADFSDTKHDNLIMATALTYKLYNPIIITDDANFRTICRSQGVDAIAWSDFLKKRGVKPERKSKVQNESAEVKIIEEQETVVPTHTEETTELDLTENQGIADFEFLLAQNLDELKKPPFNVNKKQIKALNELGFNTIQEIYLLSEGDINRKCKSASLRTKVLSTRNRLINLKKQENVLEKVVGEEQSTEKALISDKTTDLARKVVTMAKKAFQNNAERIKGSEVFNTRYEEFLKAVELENPDFKAELESFDDDIMSALVRIESEYLK